MWFGEEGFLGTRCTLHIMSRKRDRDEQEDNILETTEEEEEEEEINEYEQQKQAIMASNRARFQPVLDAANAL